MYSDQGYSSVFVNWTKQVCLQTRLKWWQWWGTPDIIWNRVPDRRRSKRKWTITKCCLTVCRSIEKRHGVWAGASVAGVQWLFMQHVSDIWWCSTAVTVVAQLWYKVGCHAVSSAVSYVLSPIQLGVSVREVRKRRSLPLPHLSYIESPISQEISGSTQERFQFAESVLGYSQMECLQHFTVLPWRVLLNLLSFVCSLFFSLYKY